MDLCAAEVGFSLDNSFLGLHTVKQVHGQAQCDIFIELVPLGGIPFGNLVLVVGVFETPDQRDCRLVAAFFNFDVLFGHCFLGIKHHQFLTALDNVCHGCIGERKV